MMCNHLRNPWGLCYDRDSPFGSGSEKQAAGWSGVRPVATAPTRKGRRLCFLGNGEQWSNSGSRLYRIASRTSPEGWPVGSVTSLRHLDRIGGSGKIVFVNGVSHRLASHLPLAALDF